MATTRTCLLKPSFLLLPAIGLALGVLMALSVVPLPERPPEAATASAVIHFNPNSGVMPGARAPEFALATLAGGTTRLSEHRGHRVLLNFFTSWCQPCRDEMPGVQSQAEQHARHDWVVLGVDVMESLEAVQAFQAEFGLTFPILLDETGSVSVTYQVTGTPTSLFINAQGVIVERRIGYMSEAEIAEAIGRVP